jgi:hypothetical protein
VRVAFATSTDADGDTTTPICDALDRVSTVTPGQSQEITGTSQEITGTASLLQQLRLLAFRRARLSPWRASRDGVAKDALEPFRPRSGRVPCCLLGEEITVDLLVARLKEDRLAAITALRYVVSNAGNDDAREPCHASTVAMCARQGADIL